MPDDVYDKYCRDGPRRNETPTPVTVEVGERFRRGRRQVGLSQRRVAFKSGITQSEISRFERGMTPGMSAYRVFAIALALGPRFPFGTCPHDHQCAYSIERPEDELRRRVELMRRLDSDSGDEED